MTHRAHGTQISKTKIRRSEVKDSKEVKCRLKRNESATRGRRKLDSGVYAQFKSLRGQMELNLTVFKADDEDGNRR